MPAGSAMTSASARQARCINRAAEAWLHSARPQKKPRREAGLSFCSLTSRKGLAAWRSPHQRNRQRWGSSIGGKPLTQHRAEPLVSVSDDRPKPRGKSPASESGTSFKGLAAWRSQRHRQTIAA